MSEQGVFTVYIYTTNYDKKILKSILTNKLTTQTYKLQVIILSIDLGPIIQPSVHAAAYMTNNTK